MNDLNIGIFHDEKLGSELGKKGTESDILMFNRKTDDFVFTFMSPVEDKLSTKTQIISTLDAAIIVCEKITPEIGETILLLDSMRVNSGLIVVPEFTDTTQIEDLIKDTSLSSFSIVEKDNIKIIQEIEKFKIKRDNDSSAVVIIDHSFSVKGVGEVVLGVVKQGVIHKHDKLRLMPLDKEIVVRSIQMQDKDFDEAFAGCRVGLAIKGASSEEMKRGTLIGASDAVKTGTIFSLEFAHNRFYPDLKPGVYHCTVGMQTFPVKINKVEDKKITIESEKLVCYSDDSKFILIDLNAEKLHHIGTGKIV
jgi:selenocysteine-specific translation elongation factor